MKRSQLVMRPIPQAARVVGWLLPGSSGGVCVFKKSPENILLLWKNGFKRGAPLWLRFILKKTLPFHDGSGGSCIQRGGNEAVCMKASAATSRGLRSPVKMYRPVMHPSPRFPGRWAELTARLPVAGRKSRVTDVGHITRESDGTRLVMGEGAEMQPW